MALTWDWNNKIGELLIKQGEREFTMSVYEGNALAIFLHEFTDEEGTEKYTMYQFFCDKEHFKNCAKAKDWNYAEEWVRLTLTRVPRADFWHIVKDLATRGVEVVIKVERNGR